MNEWSALENKDAACFIVVFHGFERLKLADFFISKQGIFPLVLKSFHLCPMIRSGSGVGRWGCPGKRDIKLQTTFHKSNISKL